MKDVLINAGLSLLSKNNDFKTHTKSVYFDEVDECLNKLESLVCGILSDTWSYFDESPRNKQEINNKFIEINKKFLELKTYRDTHKTKISQSMLEILGEIEVELFREMESIETLFFIKTDILDDLENKFIKQLKKDRKLIEKGKKL